MASIITLPLMLPSPPSGWTKPSPSRPSPPTKLPIYPAGPSFISRARRQILQRSFAQDDEAVLAARQAKADQQKDAGTGLLFPGLGEEQESAATLANDPKEWKKQDHYAVLGLGDLRYLATDEHIKVAHRRKVLRHHPDKKAGQSGTNDDAFFKCIQKAHETLTNSDRRHQFDSVDWNIEDEVPDLKKLPADRFCEIVAPVFAREARFSTKQPVPGFGGNGASKKEVEAFYDFWYNFDSWRSFEWHDKEVNEGSDSRDDKRFTEKKNKSERARRKKEDIVRLRELVDNTLANDPRTKRIKAEEKAARDAKKKPNGVAKPLTAVEKKKAEEDKKKADAAKAVEEKKNLEATKGDREAAKKAKEAARKNLKKWKKGIAGIITANNYFLPAGAVPGPQVIEKQLAELDILCELLEPEEVKDLKEKLDTAGNGEAVKSEIVGKAKGLGGKGQGKFTEFA